MPHWLATYAQRIPPQRVAIVGSRGFRALEMVRVFVASLPQGTTIVSGGAEGPDSVAQGVAEAQERPIQVWRPPYQQYAANVAPKVRNTWIVQDSGSVAAFWDKSSRGTLDTIEKARQAGNLILVYREDFVCPIVT